MNVPYEEYRSVVPHKIQVSILCIELNCKTSRVPEEKLKSLVYCLVLTNPLSVSGHTKFLQFFFTWIHTYICV